MTPEASKIPGNSESEPSVEGLANASTIIPETDSRSENSLAVLKGSSDQDLRSRVDATVPAFELSDELLRVINSGFPCEELSDELVGNVRVARGKLNEAENAVEKVKDIPVDAVRAAANLAKVTAEKALSVALDKLPEANAFAQERGDYFYRGLTDLAAKELEGIVQAALEKVGLASDFSQIVRDEQGVPYKVCIVKLLKDIESIAVAEELRVKTLLAGLNSKVNDEMNGEDEGVEEVQKEVTKILTLDEMKAKFIAAFKESRGEVHQLLVDYIVAHFEAIEAEQKSEERNRKGKEVMRGTGEKLEESVVDILRTLSMQVSDSYGEVLDPDLFDIKMLKAINDFCKNLVNCVCALDEEEGDIGLALLGLSDDDLTQTDVLDSQMTWHSKEVGTANEGASYKRERLCHYHSLRRFDFMIEEVLNNTIISRELDADKKRMGLMLAKVVIGNVMRHVNSLFVDREGSDHLDLDDLKTKFDLIEETLVVQLKEAMKKQFSGVDVSVEEDMSGRRSVQERIAFELNLERFYSGESNMPGFDIPFGISAPMDLDDLVDGDELTTIEEVNDDPDRKLREAGLLHSRKDLIASVEEAGDPDSRMIAWLKNEVKKRDAVEESEVSVGMVEGKKKRSLSKWLAGLGLGIGVVGLVGGPVAFNKMLENSNDSNSTLVDGSDDGEGGVLSDFVSTDVDTASSDVVLASYELGTIIAVEDAMPIDEKVPAAVWEYFRNVDDGAVPDVAVMGECTDATSQGLTNVVKQYSNDDLNSSDLIWIMSEGDHFLKGTSLLNSKLTAACESRNFQGNIAVGVGFLEELAE